MDDGGRRRQLQAVDARAPLLSSPHPVVGGGVRVTLRNDQGLAVLTRRSAAALLSPLVCFSSVPHCCCRCHSQPLAQVAALTSCGLCATTTDDIRYVVPCYTAAGLGLLAYDSLTGKDMHDVARRWFEYHRTHMVMPDPEGRKPARTTMYGGSTHLSALTFLRPPLPFSHPKASVDVIRVVVCWG